MLTTKKTSRRLEDLLETMGFFFFGDSPLQNGDLPLNKQWFTYVNGDFPLKNCDLPKYNGDSFKKTWWFSWVI